MKHPPLRCFVLTICLAFVRHDFFVVANKIEAYKKVPGRQFKWGACLLKSNGGVYQG